MTDKPQNPLAELLRAAKAYYDKEITQPEACPTGDDFNNLYSLVMSYAKLIEPLPTKAPAHEPRAPTVYECPDCDWTGTLDTINGIHHIHHIQEFLEAGELVPAGCCPECNSVIGVEDPDVPHYTLYHVGVTMRQRGWTVIPPADCPQLEPTTPTKGA